MRAPTPLLLSLALLACWFAACSFDWDGFDPRLGPPGVGGRVGAGAAGGTGAGGSGASSSSAGGAGGAGGTPASGSVRCAAHFPAVESSYMRSVMLDSAGGIVVAGPIQGGIDFGGGMLVAPAGRDSAAIAKLDANCQHLWSHVFPGSTDKTYFWAAAMTENGDSVAVGGITASVDFGGGTLTPVGNEDTVVVRFDGAGNHVWSVAYGASGGGQWPSAVAIDPAGDVVVFGSYYTAADFGGTPLTGDGFFVAKLSGNDGSPVWSVGFPSNASTRARSIAIDGAGNIFITGRFITSVDVGGNNLAAVGSARDGFVAKLDAGGAVLWARRFGSATGTVHDYGMAVATVGNGEALLTGRFDEVIAFDSGSLTTAGDRDIFLARLDSSGMSSWTLRLGGASFDSAPGLAVDPSSNIVLAGRFTGTTDLGGMPLSAVDDADLFVARYDRDGNHQLSQSFGGMGYQHASAVTTGADGRIAVTGYFDGELDFGQGPWTAVGSLDGFVVTLWP